MKFPLPFLRTGWANVWEVCRVLKKEEEEGGPVEEKNDFLFFNLPLFVSAPPLDSTPGFPLFSGEDRRIEEEEEEEGGGEVSAGRTLSPFLPPAGPGEGGSGVDAVSGGGGNVEEEEDNVGGASDGGDRNFSGSTEVEKVPFLISRIICTFCVGMAGA